MDQKARLRKVTRVCCPGYPTREEFFSKGFNPAPSSVVTNIVKGATKTAISLVAFAFSGGTLVAQEVLKRDHIPTSELHDQKRDRPVQALNTQQGQTRHKIHIKRLTEAELRGIVSDDSQRIMHSPVRINTAFFLREVEACELIRRFLQKNGLKLEKDVKFQEGGVDFKVDGYDRDRGWGFEFRGYSQKGYVEQDLTEHEEDELARMAWQGKAHILVLDGEEFCYEMGLKRAVIDELLSEVEDFLIKLHRIEKIELPVNRK
jgi:hypothetical protein